VDRASEDGRHWQVGAAMLRCDHFVAIPMLTSMVRTAPALPLERSRSMLVIGLEIKVFIGTAQHARQHQTPDPNAATADGS
jgi:hypothetical protein